MSTNRQTVVRLCLLAVCATSLYVPALAQKPEPYLGPCALVASTDGRTLYVAHRDARQVATVDLPAGAVTGSIQMPGRPTGLALTPDGAKLAVTCADAQSTVVLLDTATRQITAAVPAGHTAVGPAITPDGRTLFVCNRFDNDVSVIDLQTARHLARIPVDREPVGAAATPDGRSVVVINHLPRDRSDAFHVAATVTFIDAGSLSTTSVRLPNGSTALRAVCLSPDGARAYVTHTLANYHLVPTVVTGGWINHNVLTILDTVQKERIDTVFLDELDLGAGNPWGVASTPDARSILIAHAGSRELTVIDAVGLAKKLDQGIRNTPIQGGSPYYPGILGVLGRRIKLQGQGPRALAVVGSTAYVAGLFSDTLDVVDVTLPSDTPPRLLRLGPAPRLSTIRRGELLFHDATICFQQWQSCSTCHPDARTDGLNWDLMNDGVGNPKNTKTMLLAHATPPAMWTAVRPTSESAVRGGIEHTLFTDRPEADARAIDAYLRSLRPQQSPHLVDGRLSPAALRGQEIFRSPTIGCSRCHPAPLYTDLRTHDVGSRHQSDQRSQFDTPTLIETWRTAPYLHDGSSPTLHHLLQDAKHGIPTDQLDQQQIDDLVQFVLSL